ncbi:class IV adenylate cyclase [Halobellus sp. Atlit-38R]|uniref:class IV adenylate cyclase n=1 Tax=Halobellus sp. Atlit-38R TaxID=2282131 RepID=UPI000EF181EE|nr:class IV adenylate cyclase [Halobellus sp. Atlit-38R]RLM94479.1 class IV adenylate cyclase [Halobellus sp. Atlit-38R]
MFEVEVKLRAAHDAIRPALVEADAVFVERVTQVDTYYDAPHRDFAETDEALRLRRETRESDVEGELDRRSDDDPAQADQGAATTKLTYKGPLVDADSKTREEHETGVDDGDTAEAIFDGLGFEPAAVVEKHRTFYELDGYTVTLDQVAGLGEFVEVEAEAEASDDVANVREGAFDVLRTLGLDPTDQIRTSYLGMLLESDAE